MSLPDIESLPALGSQLLRDVARNAWHGMGAPDAAEAQADLAGNFVAPLLPGENVVPPNLLAQVGTLPAVNKVREFVANLPWWAYAVAAAIAIFLIGRKLR